MKRPLLAFALLLCATAGFGGEKQDYSGNTVLAKCKTALRSLDGKSESSFDRGYCIGWINAAISAYPIVRYYADHLPLSSDLRCIPEEVTNQQIVQVFVKWMEAHPEKLHLDPFGLFSAAMEEAFPCESSSRTKKPRPTPAPRQ